MNKKQFLVLLIIFVALGISFPKNRNEKSSYLYIPVHFFPFNDKPIIQARIEGKLYSLLVDLGSSHSLDLQKRHLEKIKNKSRIGMTKYVGIKGKTYSMQGFRVPKLSFENLTIENLVAYEENSDFIQDAKTWVPSGITDRLNHYLRLSFIDGRIGWNLFQEAACIFDFANSSIYLGTDIDSLMHDLGGSLDEFIEISFELEKYGIVISAETDYGLQRFLLDTGASKSVLRNILRDSINLNIGSYNLGPWKFLRYNFSELFDCDGILGVDFFKKHKICLDFHNKKAYIKKRI